MRRSTIICLIIFTAVVYQACTDPAELYGLPAQKGAVAINNYSAPFEKEKIRLLGRIFLIFKDIDPQKCS